LFEKGGSSVFFSLILVFMKEKDLRLIVDSIDSPPTNSG
jgi:hypothetical protein